MDQAITRSSRLVALAGVAGIIFGIVALVWPGITLIALVALFGAYAFVAGAFTLVAGLDFVGERASHWVPMLLGGLAGIAIGVVTFFRPGITALALVFLIAAWAIVTGVFEVVTGIEFTGQVKGSWTLWLAGLFSVAFGVLIAVNPGSGVLAILWLIGFYAILGGVLRLVFAYRMRNDRTRIKSAVRNLGAAASR
ncbi:MAG: hypothetical protein QOJ33_732 [Chloroflexota bacterium]|nr:hypothetical protein [Chloroflexota bacterium]MEA2667798.1 hypothetical protein [Chloroflexota bacterium]